MSDIDQAETRAFAGGYGRFELHNWVWMGSRDCLPASGRITRRLAVRRLNGSLYVVPEHWSILDLYGMGRSSEVVWRLGASSNARDRRSTGRRRCTRLSAVRRSGAGRSADGAFPHRAHERLVVDPCRGSPWCGLRDRTDGPDVLVPAVHVDRRGPDVERNRGLPVLLLG
jgi:hypothetical protein